MKLRKKYRIGLEARLGRLPDSDIGELTQVDKSFVRRQGRALDRNGYMAFGPSWLDIAVASMAAKRPLTGLQVGANDGQEGDPVCDLFHRYADKIILVEPIPELIPKLEATYAKFPGQLMIENSAISRNSDNFSLWRLKPEHWEAYQAEVGRHPTAIASFDPEPLLKKIATRMHVEPVAAEEMVEELRCPAESLEALLTRHGWQDLDLLQVDAEGYDLEIIKSLGKYRPSLINFESFNLSEKDWTQWKRWAAQEGYGYIQGRMDTLAIRHSHFTIEY